LRGVRFFDAEIEKGQVYALGFDAAIFEGFDAVVICD
jgi:hypothetical protein